MFFFFFFCDDGVLCWGELCPYYTLYIVRRGGESHVVEGNGFDVESPLLGLDVHELLSLTNAAKLRQRLFATT